MALYTRGVRLDIAVSKVRKYATRESGDTLEVIERPLGGLSLVLADGQRSGRSAKHIANMVVRKVVALLAEGVRDGAAARAAADYLYAERGGRVQATLNILSVDMDTRTLVITRNNPLPVFVLRQGHLLRLAQETPPVGLRRHVRPRVEEFPLEVGLWALMFTDGLANAGLRTGHTWDPGEAFARHARQPQATPRQVADALMGAALELDAGRPVDDISIVVLAVAEHAADQPPIRDMDMRLPLV